MGSALKKLLFLSVLLFATNIYASPTTTISVPNSFTANTVIQSASVNSDFNEVSTKYNSHSHTDISQLGTITVGTWQGSVVGTQYGGTGKDWSATASGALPYFNGTGALTTLAKPASGSILFLNGSTQQWDTIPQGTSGQLLKSNGANANPTFTTAGKVVQVVSTETGTYSATSATIPSDNTIPQITEGTEYMTRAITPTATGNVLIVDVTLQGVITAAGSDDCTVALFNTDVNATNAISVMAKRITTNNSIECLSFRHYMTAGTTSATTFRVRAGCTTNGFAFNSLDTPGSAYGGTLASSITVTEVQNP